MDHLPNIPNTEGHRYMDVDDVGSSQVSITSLAHSPKQAFSGTFPAPMQRSSRGSSFVIETDNAGNHATSDIAC